MVPPAGPATKAVRECELLRWMGEDWWQTPLMVTVVVADVPSLAALGRA